MYASSFSPSVAREPRDEGSRTSTRRPPPDLIPLVNSGEADVIRQLVALAAPYSVIKVLLVLGSLCKRYEEPGTFAYQCYLADNAKLGESTVRVALDWLEAQGFISRSQILVKGIDRVMIWCLWLIPSGRFDRETFDLGQGLPRRKKSARKVDPTTKPQTIPICSPSAESCAQPNAPRDRKWIGIEDSSPDDRPRERGRVVVPASLGGEEDRTSSPTLPATTSPTPPAGPPPDLDPRIEAELHRQIPDADEREALASKILTWTATHRTQWIINAIRQLAFNRAKMAAKGQKIRDLAAYAEGILADWKAAGRCTLRGVKEAIEQAPNTPSPEQADAAKAERQHLAATTQARHDRWQALSADAQAALQAEWEAANPPDPSTARSGRRPASDPLRKLQWIAWRDEELERRSREVNPS